VAIDGKALRRALDEGGKLRYSVNAWATEKELVLGQVKVGEKSNEITAIPELLRTLHPEGCIVTIDAMGCQKDIAAEIVAAKADYVLALKGNHPTVHEESRECFEDAVPARAGVDTPFPEGMVFHESVDKGHGRIEIRRCWQTGDTGWFQDRKLSKGLASVGMVESVHTVRRQTTTERRLHLSSLQPDAERLAEAIRNHWGVENSVHWTLDVLFGEDQSRTRTRTAAQNLATLRRLALNLLKNDKASKKSIRSRRNTAALDNRYRESQPALDA
jgi:predicted transposase YbfD/YdcC